MNANPVVRALLQRLRAVPTLLKSLPSRLRALPAKLRALSARLRTPAGKKQATTVGVAAAAAAMLLLVAIPRGPEAQTARMALSGRDLFEALQQQHAGTARSSRVHEGAERGSGTNLIVLSETSWETLAVDQRNSLGSWLNQLGGRWEIRVGRATEDDQRILDAAAVITSSEWNAQLK